MRRAGSMMGTVSRRRISLQVNGISPSGGGVRVCWAVVTASRAWASIANKGAEGERLRGALGAQRADLRTRQLNRLPNELKFGCGMTCWRQLRDWNNAGVWQRLHEVLLAELRAAGKLDPSLAVVDSSHVRALEGGPKLAGVR